MGCIYKLSIINGIIIWWLLIIDHIFKMISEFCVLKFRDLAKKS